MGGTSYQGEMSMWTDWRLWVVVARGYASPLLVLAALCWVLYAVLGGGIEWAGLLLAGACVLVLRDLFTERAATYRQHLEIDRLRARIDEYDLILDAEDQ